MIRVFAASPDLGGILHDPATGLNHHLPLRLTSQPPTGRLVLDDGELGPPISVSRAMPVSLCWSPLVRCNLACAHCLDDTSVHETDQLERHRVAGVLAGSGVLGVDISGGEPLLLRELPDLGRRVAGGGRTAASVTTNGWHLERRASELVDAFDAVRVSFDGATGETHDYHRSAGSFRRATAGVRAAVAAGLPVQLQMVLMRSNRAEAAAMVDLAVRLGAGGVTFLQMLPIGAGATVTGQMLTDDEATELVGALAVPAGFRLRLRTRAGAGGFTVIRADARVWRNDPHGTQIAGTKPLTEAADLLPEPVAAA
ncbi:radical SAM protein [Actinoplanes sp. L3-i22]|uniref:radical SAM protein n=1 Tax=Actinoplanes sp. L3-i22 TaxID=2836373 RepID=UPI001C779F92|nr:radical SAM protein [Actinoplanes sp. L3-i22]BCY11049.1 hypothetical protein L3i22_061370 [Actinoplanes sp. L3-i22]